MRAERILYMAWNFDEVMKASEPQESSNILNTRNGTAFDFNKFGPLKKYIDDSTITDIDYNGTDIWLTNINNEHWKSNIKLSPDFTNKLVQSIANSESKEFNQKHSVLEVETDDLRIAALHTSIAHTGMSICIRKTPKTERIRERYAIESNYCNKEILSLLANCVKAHLNIVVCGNPRAGKTELAKFISGFIPENERVITIEDVLEWHYKDLHPTADVIELKVNKDFSYSDGIIASLKQNPKWIMIAETRGKEIKNLIQSFTTGVNGITTLHTDDARLIPERMINMSEEATDPIRMENTIYSFLDVGVLVSIKTDEQGNLYRFIDQICFFSNMNGVNGTNLVVNDGMFYRNSLPQSIENKFKRVGIEKPLENEEVLERLIEQGFDYHTTQDLTSKLTYKNDKENQSATSPIKEKKETTLINSDVNNNDFSFSESNILTDNNDNELPSERDDSTKETAYKKEQTSSGENTPKDDISTFWY